MYLIYPFTIPAYYSPWCPPFHLPNLSSFLVVINNPSPVSVVHKHMVLGHSLGHMPPMRAVLSREHDSLSSALI